MGGVPGYTFVCQQCKSELVLTRLEMEKFAVTPCKECSSASMKILNKENYRARNLIYHVTPIANYKWNIEQLVKRWDVFTGTKVIAIAVAKEFDSIDDVTKLFPKDAKFFPVLNHPELRETHSLATLLLEASKFDRAGTTFYAHTKGVTRGDDPAVTAWTDAMYHYNLDDIQKVDKQLQQYAITGCCKRRGKFANFPRLSTWHYSGTFFWFRNKDLFDKNWTAVPQIRYGAEAYLSLLFKDLEAGCLWADKFHNGYDWNYIKALVQNDPYFADFLAKNIDNNSNWSKAKSLRTVQTLDRKAVAAPR